MEEQPIIRRSKKKSHEGSHGSWKVALADFAIAMMAFFLLMWILNMATQDERRSIAGYFEKPEEFTPPSDIPPSSVIMDEDITIEREKIVQRTDVGFDERKDLKEILAQQEQEKMEKLLVLLEQEIRKNEILREYNEHIYLDVTDEGLRIQILDQEERSMFDRSSSMMYRFATEILENLAEPLNSVENRISIAGHTDADQFQSNEMTNWELSSQRANAARRALIEGGLAEGKVARVVGLADTVLFDKENPNSAVNRRISIVVLKKDKDLRH